MIRTPLEPNDDQYSPRLAHRNRQAGIWHRIYQFSTVVGLVVLFLLVLNISNNVLGYVTFEAEIDPDELVVNGVPLEEMTKDQLIQVFRDHVSAGLYRRFDSELPFAERDAESVYALLQEWVLKPRILEVHSLFNTILHGSQIKEQAAQDPEHPNAYVKFTNWLTLKFITSPQQAEALRAGVRTAILGSLWTIVIAMAIAFPVGVGAAIYLQEYAADTPINRIIQTNINNLAGVPSIIYGLLGLAIFARALVSLTSGAAFGMADQTTANGRTILSAGLTLGLLVMPMIIINAQEAIRAVPNSLRQASYGLGATRWQTIWHHVLPSAVPGILTGTILAISRAIGETAPLVVVGASTFVNQDPNGPFSKFTTLPIQIYQWTSRPQDEFRSLAAAAIIVLLIMLLSLNAVAVLMRNRFSQRN